jgi:hypothetical protein
LSLPTPPPPTHFRQAPGAALLCRLRYVQEGVCDGCGYVCVPDLCMCVCVPACLPLTSRWTSGPACAWTRLPPRSARRWSLERRRPSVILGHFRPFAGRGGARSGGGTARILWSIDRGALALHRRLAVAPLGGARAGKGASEAKGVVVAINEYHHQRMTWVL